MFLNLMNGRVSFIMVKHRCKSVIFLIRPLILSAGLMLLFCSPAWCGSTTHKSNPLHIRLAGNTHSDKKHSKKYSYEEKKRLKKKAKKFKSMPSEKQDDLRHKMDKFKSLSSKEQKLYKKRYQQLQKLPPQDRDQVRKKLEKVDRLSPQEKEEIRKKFK